MANWVAEAVATVTEADEPIQVRLLLPRLMDDGEFGTFCRRNPDLRIEQTAEGELVLMPPTCGETGDRNAEMTTQTRLWARVNGTGRAFDSSTGFVLPSGAKRSPDVSWVENTRLAALTPEQKRSFLPLCPDFVVELRSPSDRLGDIQAKMAEYVANGARLGWLIDPVERQVIVYRPGSEPVTLDRPTTLSGAPELPGFILDLAPIWTPGF